MTKKLNPLSFSAELLQKVLLNILYQVKAHYKCMYIIRERDREPLRAYGVGNHRLKAETSHAA